MSYQSVTASNFFEVHEIEVDGVQRSSKEEINRIVSSRTKKTGVWNADLEDIKQKIEKVAFVKTAAVSRVLPNNIRVHIIEREPHAVVRLASGDVLVDGEGKFLAAAEIKEDKLPFALTGWDEAKTEKAFRENLERVKMYQTMLAEWQQFDLALRVVTVDLVDLREPKATVEDSGLPVSIALRKEDFGEHLKKGIKAIVGKGATFEAVNLVGANMILSSRKPQ